MILLYHTKTKYTCSQSRHIHTNFSLLSEELDKLRDLFISNGYPLSTIDRYMQHIQVLRHRQVCFGPKKCPIYLKLPWLGDCSTRFDNRISHNIDIIISSAFPALKLLCCFSSRSTFSTTNKDVLPLTTLSNLVYSFTCVCERRYVPSNLQIWPICKLHCTICKFPETCLICKSCQPISLHNIAK